MKAEVADFEIGKRHLANIMGEDPDSFTQADVDVSVSTSDHFYLPFFSSLCLCNIYYLIVIFIKSVKCADNLHVNQFNLYFRKKK